MRQRERFLCAPRARWGFDNRAYNGTAAGFVSESERVMRKRAVPEMMIAAPAVALLAFVGVFGACAGAQVATPPAATATPGPSVTAVATPAPATAVPLAAPQPAPAPIGAPSPGATSAMEFIKHTQPASERSPAFSFSYPASWHLSLPEPKGIGLTIELRSYDPETWTEPWFPPESVKVEFIVLPPANAASRPGDGRSASLSGIPGWEYVRDKDPDTSGNVTREHLVAAESSGFQFVIAGIFAQTTPDEFVFSKIVDSFRVSP